MDTKQKGTRVRLVRYNGPLHYCAPGSMGKVDWVDPEGTVHVKFDDGRTLGMVPGRDAWVAIPPEVPADTAAAKRFMSEVSGVLQGIEDFDPNFGTGDLHDAYCALERAHGILFALYDRLHRRDASGARPEGAALVKVR